VWKTRNWKRVTFYRHNACGISSMSVTSPPLLACALDGHIHFFGNLEINNLLHFRTYVFIKKFTGHTCPPSDDICRSNCKILPVSDRHLFRGLVIGMFGMRNFRYRYTEKIIPILSVYRFSFDNYKGNFFNGNFKEILSNSKRENDNVEHVLNNAYSV
jgi:hypothetical protein